MFFFNKSTSKENIEEEVLKKQRIPILLNYEPWKKLVSTGHSKDMLKIAESLKVLLNEQKKVALELKKLSDDKSKITARIIYISSQVNENFNPKLESELEKLKEDMEKMIAKIAELEDKSMDLPYEVKEKNLELLKETISYSYGNMRQAEKDLETVEDEIKKIRIRLHELRESRDILKEKTDTVYRFIYNLLGSEASDKHDEKWK